MSDLETEQISEQQVLDYLQKNVNFLHQHPEILVTVDLEHSMQGTVSLVERQVKALRDQNKSLQGQLIQLLKAAQDNEALFAGCTELFERWLGEPKAGLIIESLSDDIRELFAVDKVRLVLNDGEEQSARKICEQLKITFPDGQPLCGPCDLSTSSWLFSNRDNSNSSENYKSMALIPIGTNANEGILIFASEDADGFKATMGTLFLDQIGRVLSSLLE